MSVLTGRDGQISVVRVGTIVAVIGVLLVVAAAVAFYLDQTSRQVPLDIAPFPGAESLGVPDPVGTSRNLYYVVPGVLPEEVVAHYQQIMESHYGDTGERCKRFPDETNNYPGSNQRNDVVPYEYICLFDRSGFFATQFTKVTIQPGLFHQDPAANQQGNTLVEHQQIWEAS